MSEVFQKISIVIPSLNQGQYIESCLLSVINQHYQNLELIVIDGGSEDETLGILEKYSSKITFWSSEMDSGQTEALRKGFEMATGDIFAWLNSDDQLVEGSLSTVNREFKEPKIDMIFGDALWVDANDCLIRPQHEMPFVKYIWMYTYNYIPGMSCFWRRSLYQSVGGVNTHYNLAMDADLWIRFSNKGKIKHVRKILSRMRYYKSQKNISLRQDSNKEEYEIRLREWDGKHPRFYGLKRIVAYTLRVVFKTFYGCYTIKYKRNLSKYYD